MIGQTTNFTDVMQVGNGGTLMRGTFAFGSRYEDQIECYVWVGQ